MKNLSVFFTLLILLCFEVKAEVLRFRAPAISGKILSTNVELTDWQTVMSCQFQGSRNKKDLIRYPHTNVTKLSSGHYSLKIHAQNLGDFSLGSDVSNCFYKLILIGKNTITHQLAFGDILLLGKEAGMMSESELLSLFDLSQNTKALNEKVRELSIAFGKDGGIEEL